MKNTRCVILAAGLSTRMNTQIPKALHRIGNKPLLARLVKNVKSTGIDNIVVVVGYGSEKVENALKKYKVKTVKQKQLLGSADAVKSVDKHFNGFTGDILILYTDTPLIEKDTLKHLVGRHAASKAACTLLTTSVSDATGYGRILRDPKGKVVKIVEEKDASPEEKQIREINIGAYCFKKKDLFNTINKIEKNAKKREFYLTDIIGLLRKKGALIESFDGCASEQALGINSRADLSAAEKIVRTKKIKELMKQGVTFIDPATAYIDEDVNIDKDTIIYPSVIIEGEVRIGKNCRIGPFARIRGNTKIADNCIVGNFVEIVRSDIASNTKVKHHAYLGDAVVGKNVNIGAGTITANYDGKNKHKTIIKDSAFIGIGARLIAPIKIGKGAIVGAGSVVTKNKNVGDNEVVAGVPAKPLNKRADYARKGVKK